jgi:hypothetical protein
MGPEIIRGKCPMAFEEVIFNFSNSDELVLTQRKIDGTYQKVLKPRKEVKGAMEIRIDCRAVDRTRSMTSLTPPNPWCKKRRDICPIYEIARTLLREKGFEPSKTRFDKIVY